MPYKDPEARRACWRRHYQRHAETHRQRKRDNYHHHKQLGICVRCGNEDARPNRADCAKCANKEK